MHYSVTIQSPNPLTGFLIVLAIFGISWIVFVTVILFQLLLLLVHIALWPIITKPLYAAIRHNMIRQHKWFFRVGIAFVCLGFAPLESIVHWLQRIVSLP